MLGSDLAKYLNSSFSITAINRENYSQHINTKFDIVLNANGNSKRFWANQNPLEDFFESTLSVYKSIFDFPSKVYIYISSPDVYENHDDSNNTKENQIINPSNLSPYGFNKYLSELIVKKYKENFLILRPAMILGSKMKKGPIFDILSKVPLHISLDSKIQFITTQALAEVIKTLLEKSVNKDTFNVGGENKFEFSQIQKYFKQKINILPEAEIQTYEMNIEKIKRLYPLKTSVEYLKDFLDSAS